MTTNQCPFCSHENVADEKFCSACGSVLNLVPCPKCEAVNKKTAATCYRCHTEFEPAPADALPAPRETTQDAVLARAEPPVAESAKSKRQPPFVVGIVLIAFAVASYFSYRQLTVTPTSGTADTGATSSEAPATAPAAKAAISGVSKKPDASPSLRAPALAGENPRTPEASLSVAMELPPVAAAPAPTAVASAPVATTLPPSAPAPAPAAAAPAPAAAAPAPEQSTSPKPDPRRSRYSVAGGVDGGRTKPPAQCTEAIAALGLCTLQSNQTRQ